ncbi:MAG: hypothetical protein KDD34_04520 [Bdellovibrionales bacterium]|nr:hypothetical protein [Bdellovibrionales bacterium]
MLTFKAFAGEASIPHAEFPQSPFWSKKEETYEKMLKERSIFVSVKTVKNPHPQFKGAEQLQILGAGIVNKHRGRSFQVLKQFDKWSEIHEVIVQSTWTPETHRLFLHMKAFNYMAKMIMKVEVKTEKDMDTIYMHVQEGAFKGMRVAFRLKDAKSRKTEISMTAQYEFDKLPMPRFFIEFGLEVIFQKIAEKTRSHIEQS